MMIQRDLLATGNICKKLKHAPDISGYWDIHWRMHQLIEQVPTFVDISTWNKPAWWGLIVVICVDDACPASEYMTEIRVNSLCPLFLDGPLLARFHHISMASFRFCPLLSIPANKIMSNHSSMLLHCIVHSCMVMHGIVQQAFISNLVLLRHLEPWIDFSPVEITQVELD